MRRKDGAELAAWLIMGVHNRNHDFVCCAEGLVSALFRADEEGDVLLWRNPGIDALHCIVAADRKRET